MKFSALHILPRRPRKTKEEVGAVGHDPEPATVNLSPAMEGSPKRVHGRFRHKLKMHKILGFVLSPRSPKPIVESNPPQTEVALDFMENLKENRLVEACQQLLLREDQLFGQETMTVEGLGQVCNEDDKDMLQKDYETLLLHLWMAVHTTFSSTPSGEHLEILRSAVETITLLEEKDQQWEGRPEGSREAPVWRPHQCRLTHDTLLEKMVESQMRNAAVEEDNISVSSVDNLSTSMKREVCRMGKRLKETILRVARDIRDCYPPDFDVCNLYVRLYHQKFSARLTELARSGLDVDDCNYLLCWVNNYYPNDILKHKDLEGHINIESLGTLLSEKDLTTLEEQYLLQKESTVRTWFSKALSKKEEGWLSGKSPELIDGYCFCPLAIDIIQAVDGTMREARTILCSEGKAQRILCQLDSFLISYKRSLEEFVKGRRENTQAVVKANLVNIEQFRDFIVRREESIPEEIKTSCMSTLADLRDCGYGYFTGPIHEELRVQYRRLWTEAWFTGGQMVLDEVLGTLDRHMQQFTDLKPICMEELVGRLHMEMMVEYVKRMMKKKMKLKDKEQQEAAAKLLADDSSTLSTYFTEAGSKISWLSEVLPKMAEVVRLQDPGSIQLEIVTLARDFPDLSWRQISALLSLKANLSTADVRGIKESLEVNRPTVTSSNTNPPFFSKVPAGTFWQMPS
ncbi:tumor necrosis factor alpha-induced protein 2 isoform X1 [Salmo salar]|uniref:Tumor necrosis factor alpha-induced protein 2 isoform X1 n=1 Tax=Salmo salar TaxID=8030 RepID=A0A1S3M7X0_SALSA|nr:tumor necrosis factor alpha-induced protein 2-like isoform X1 [Salmo salar]|eukprot:XP_013999277.1 PREDICTED: tumor necrosis factor alpha-induced protein 2-like isoform X1 [Salmo salar]